MTVSLAFPLRPRLAEHVLARRHRMPGLEVVYLLDTRDGSVHAIEPHEWTALSCADGTRDLDGIVLAAAARGALRRVSALRALLGSLHELGLLTDGTASPRPVLEEAPETPSTRELDVLDFRLACDGRGTCCRTYGSVAFWADEAERARVAAPTVAKDFGDTLFLPHRGSTEHELVAVTLSGGACPFLGGEGRCVLQASAGAAAKPLGCRHYPATFVDDGDKVRVSVGVECACVARSVGAAGGEPLVAGGLRSVADLPPRTRIQRLPLRLLVRGEQLVDRHELVAWSRAWSALPAPRDVAAAFAALARDVRHHGLSLGAMAERVPELDELPATVVALARGIAERAGSTLSTLRPTASESTRLGLAWMAASEPDATSISGDPVEQLYLRSTIHGHLAVFPNVAEALLRRAAHVVLARAMSRTDAPALALERFAHPLVAVAALARSLALEPSADER